MTIGLVVGGVAVERKRGWWGSRTTMEEVPGVSDMALAFVKTDEK